MNATPIQRAFAAKLADACLLAMNSGFRIVPPPNDPGGADDCMCPLGALERLTHPGTKRRFPGYNITGVDDIEANHFMVAFDGESSPNATDFMTELGRSYRAWSKAKYGWQ